MLPKVKADTKCHWAGLIASCGSFLPMVQAYFLLLHYVIQRVRRRKRNKILKPVPNGKKERNEKDVERNGKTVPLGAIDC